MKFGLQIPGLILHPAMVAPWEFDAEAGTFLRVAQRADELGFDWLSVPDHIILPAEREELMGSRWPECMTVVAFLAGATRGIRLFPHVLALPYRHPVILAKSIATLDFMSGGRVIVGLGVGHIGQEFSGLNIPFENRGARVDEYIRAMKELWTSDRPTFRGDFVSFEDVVFEPKPVQKPHPPLWIGGNSRRAMRRAALVGDGWVPWLVPPSRLPECLAYIRAQPGFGDGARPFDVIVPGAVMEGKSGAQTVLTESRVPASRGEWIEAVGTSQMAGATGVGVSFGSTASLDDYLEHLERFARDVMPEFKDRGMP